MLLLLHFNDLLVSHCYVIIINFDGKLRMLLAVVCKTISTATALNFSVNSFNVRCALCKIVSVRAYP